VLNTKHAFSWRQSIDQDKPSIGGEVVPPLDQPENLPRLHEPDHFLTGKLGLVADHIRQSKWTPFVAKVGCSPPVGITGSSAS